MCQPALTVGSYLHLYTGKMVFHGFVGGFTGIFRVFSPVCGLYKTAQGLAWPSKGSDSDVLRHSVFWVDDALYRAIYEIPCILADCTSYFAADSGVCVVSVPVRSVCEIGGTA